jgi:CubicO group peptidase (beta-lactamase class C family)
MPAGAASLFRNTLNGACARSPRLLTWRLRTALSRHAPGRARALGVPWVQAAFLVADQPPLLYCTGAQGGVPVTHDSTFAVASLSKPIASLVTLLAADAGLVDPARPLGDLFAPLACFAGVPRSRLDQFTIRTLVDHQTGLAVRHSAFAPVDQTHWTLLDMLEGRMSPDLAPAIDPDAGPHRRYCGSAFGLLQFAVESVCREPFRALADRLLAAPLGLTRSSWSRDRLVAADAFDHDDQSRPLPRCWTPAAASSGLVTTAGEYLAMVRAAMLAAGALPGPRPRFMPTSVARDWLGMDLAPPFPRYHAGLHLQRDSSPPILDHRGIRTGFFGELVIAPAAGLAGVMLTNASAGEYLVGPFMGMLRDLAARRGRRRQNP